MDGSLQKKRRILQPSNYTEECDESDESDGSEDDEVLVSKGEELGEVDESAFGKLTSALEQSRYVWSSAGPLCSFSSQVSLRAQFY